MEIIIFHTLTALLAFLLGTINLFSTKGTALHKKVGQYFVLLMMIVSISAIYIQELNKGSYSLIHILIPITIVSLVVSMWSIRRYGKIKDNKYLNLHKVTIVSTYFGGLVVAGLFTLYPGRYLHNLIFT